MVKLNKKLLPSFLDKISCRFDFRHVLKEEGGGEDDYELGKISLLLLHL